MTETLLQFLHFDRFGWRSLVDILILTVIVYQILRIFQGTRAVRMLSGILVLVVAYVLTTPGRIMELPTVNRILGALLLFTPFAVVVLFQNHIRRMLAIFGRTRSRGSGAPPRPRSS
jgi:diadenylate cyclase